MPCANASAPDNAAVTPYGTLPPVAAPSARKTISLPRLREMHAQGEKITILTAHRRLIG